MLKEQHGIVVANGGLHQALGIRGRAHRHDLDAGHGMEIGLEALAVLGSELTAHTARPPHHRRNGVVAATGVAEHSHVVGDLVEGEQQEAHVHALHDRAQARHRRTDRHARESVLGDRGVEHPQFAVLVVEVLGDFVGARRTGQRPPRTHTREDREPSPRRWRRAGR